MRFDALETYENRTVGLSYYDTTEHLTSAVLPCSFCGIQHSGRKIARAFHTTNHLFSALSRLFFFFFVCTAALLVGDLIALCCTR